MNINNFLNNRRSVREFRDRPLNPDKIKEIKRVLKELLSEEEKKHINFHIYENGKIISKALEGKAGYAGVMIESPHYIAIDFKDLEDKTIIEAGYSMQSLLTEIINLDLDTCWITVNNVSKELRKSIFGTETTNVEYLLAIGKERRKNPFEKRPTSTKISVEEIVYNESIGNTFSVEELEDKGLMDIFFYVRFAPSTKNLQPWRFLVKNDEIELLLMYDQWYQSILIDAGIVMYYFEKLANYQGINNKWELINSQEIVEENYKYKRIAKIKL